MSYRRLTVCRDARIQEGVQELQRAVPFAKWVSTSPCINKSLHTSSPVIRKQSYIGEVRKEGKVPMFEMTLINSLSYTTSGRTYV